MNVAMGQFAVSREWRENAATCVRLMRQAQAQGAALLVLPEAVLATDMSDPDWQCGKRSRLTAPLWPNCSRQAVQTP